MKKSIQESVAGSFVLLGIALILYMSITLGNLNIMNKDTYQLYAKFTTVNGLRTGNPIEMHGIKIGEVKSFTLDQENQMAVAALEIDKTITIYADAIASIKTSGLIGDRFVNIDPGGLETKLTSGEYIIDTVSPLDITELIGKVAFGSITDKKTQN
jgi:phospholipid/cholesterol/gamma-HCH transport system substrate-binding protein